jgi:hypothetical protein
MTGKHRFGICALGCKPPFGYGYTFIGEGLTQAEAALCHALPHGSGIDYDWQVDRRSDGRLVLSNGYHGMDEYGGYVGTIDFSVVVDDLAKKDFRVVLHCKNRYWANYWDLKDYLGESIYWSMECAEKEYNDAI